MTAIEDLPPASPFREGEASWAEVLSPAPLAEPEGGGLEAESWSEDLAGAEPEELASTAAKGTRGYTSAHVQLVLDGTTVGSLRSASGGRPVGQVVVAQPGADAVVRKHLAGVRFEDILVTVGGELEPPLRAAIAAMLDRQPVRHDGALITVDGQGQQVSRLEFSHALLTEVGFPALDASSREPGEISLRFTPEVTRLATAGPEGKPTTKPATSVKQKAWVSSNFKLTITGLDSSRVRSVGALTVRQRVVEDAIGERRAYEKLPSTLDVPDVEVTLPAGSAGTWEQWVQDFMIAGRSDQVRTGSLEYLSTDLKQALLRLDFTGLGIYRLTEVPAKAEEMRTFRASLYCEQLSLAP